MTDELKMERYIDSVEWRIAKTMPQWPHWYTVRDWAPGSADEFTRLARKIFSDGADELWNGKAYRYLYLGQFKYWSMDSTPDSTTLINRARIFEDISSA